MHYFNYSTRKNQLKIFAKLFLTYTKYKLITITNSFANKS